MRGTHLAAGDADIQHTVCNTRWDKRPVLTEDQYNCAVPLGEQNV
jgi:hypothetical protein